MYLLQPDPLWLGQTFLCGSDDYVLSFHFTGKSSSEAKSCDSCAQSVLSDRSNIKLASFQGFLVPTLLNSEKKAVNNHIAMFFYKMGTSFSCIEDGSLAKAFDICRPGTFVHIHVIGGKAPTKQAILLNPENVCPPTNLGGKNKIFRSFLYVCACT